MTITAELERQKRLNRELVEALETLICETQYIREDKFKLRSNYLNFIESWNNACSVVANAKGEA